MVVMDVLKMYPDAFFAHLQYLRGTSHAIGFIQIESSLFRGLRNKGANHT